MNSRKFISILLCLSLLFSLNPLSAMAAEVPANDKPKDYISQLKDLGVTAGIADNQLAVGKMITRGAFTALVSNLMKYEPVTAPGGSFSDNADNSKWFFPYIEAAVKNGAVAKDSETFRPEEPITREDCAVMIVRALGHDSLAQRLAGLGSPFDDVTKNIGYITIARDLGIITGVEASSYKPSNTVTTEQAASIIISLNNILKNKLSFRNGFYAIRSSGQMDLVSKLDAVSYGWCRLQLDGNSISLNTTSADGNEYSIPSGFESPLGAAKGTRLLMITLNGADAVKIIGDQSLRKLAAEITAQAANKGLTKDGKPLSFDGLVIDFETLKGEGARTGFNEFLSEVKSATVGKKMYVAVHPKRRAGHEYYDGYDYKTIGQLADKVILMAHDYNAKNLSAEEMEQGIVMTPAAPIDEVYYALKAITDSQTGVPDKSKVLLQLNFTTVQWKLKDGKVINSKPFSPDYDALVARIQAGAERKYSDLYQSPYIRFRNTEDGTDNVVWYEDDRSIAAKLKLAERFGVGGVSLWRLGNIPDYGNDINLGYYRQLLGE